MTISMIRTRHNSPCQINQLRRTIMKSGIATFILSLVLSTSAFAKCDYADVAGTWTFFTVIGSEYSRCVVRIKGNGEQHSSQCNNAHQETFALESATFKTDSSCLVTGEIVDDYGDEHFVSAALNRDRSMMSGIVAVTNGVGTLSGVKQ
jgi:hypothetical protein